MGDTTAALQARAEGLKCGATGRTNGRRKTPCNKLAGERTTHPGQGRCWLHGGLREGDLRLKHGRYSAVVHDTIRDLQEQFRQDPDPLNLLDELALLRALAVNFIDNHEVWTEALLTWYADSYPLMEPLPAAMMRGLEQALDLWHGGLVDAGDWSPERQLELEHAQEVLALLRDGPEEQRPRKVSDIADAVGLVDKIGSMVERIDNMRGKHAISEAELNRIINMMGRSVDVVIPNAAIPAEMTGAMLKEKIREAWLDIVTR